MRVLWEPTKDLMQCETCGTIAEMTGKERVNWHAMVLDYATQEWAKCPHCGEEPMLYYRGHTKKPRVVPISGTCAHCGTDMAAGDKHCNKCGAPL